MTVLRAYAWADGKIGFGLKVPNGALEFAQHKNGQLLRDTVRMHATDNGEFIPTVSMADAGIIDRDPVDCLIDFGNYITEILKLNAEQK